MREGLSNYNKIYELEANLNGQRTTMVMTSVSGHLLNYSFPANFKSWQSCNPLVLFDAPVMKTCPEDYQRIKKTLEREIRSCQGLIIWTDCDREGENIGYEIIDVCTAVRPGLRIFRAKFSEITRQSIFRALNNLERPNKNVSDAVDVRQELDLRTGAAFTRLQTLRLQRVFPAKLADKLISYGSCQFPTLGFVVDRYKAIEEFISEPFWRIKMNHLVKDITTEFNWKRERLFDKNACEAILDICKENPMATVEMVESKPKSKWRPLPLDTVEMEKNVSRKLRITAKEAMRIAEKLYTQGLISYPRTETNIFPRELNLQPLVEQQTADNRWGPFAQRILNEGGPNPRQGKKSDQAHPPIHPTKYTNNLTGNEQRVYEYIVRHFLACVYKDALGHETTVHADIADEKFQAKGLMILERNYLDVYIYEKWNAKEIHHYRDGDTFMPSTLEMAEGNTSPPKLLTEADLIALMEKHGIGTDATHAEHIDTIKSREYVGLQENMYFIPGTLGMGLVEGYDKIGLEVSLAKPKLRAEFENDLKLICEGRKDPEVVRREQIEKYKTMFQRVMTKIRCIDETLSNRLEDRPQAYDEPIINQEEFKPVLKCPKCGNDMVLKDRKNGQGKYLGCVMYPNCKNAIWFSINVETIDILDEACPNCGPDVKKLKMKFKHNVFPGYPNPNTLCIGGCDEIVLSTLDININSVRKQTNNQNIARSTNDNRNRNNLPSTSTNNRDSGFGSSSEGNRSRNNDRYKGQNNKRDNSRSFLNSSSSTTLMPGPSGINRTLTNSNSVENDSPEDEIMCSCNNPAVLLTVRKEGPNTGRKFYKCRNGADGGGCNFFLWAADTESENPNNSGMPNPNNSRMPNPNNSRMNGTIGNHGDVRCNCRLQAQLRTVQKEGPNKGRQFYSCPKPMGEACNFFKWADDVSTQRTVMERMGDGGNSFNNGGDDWGGGGGRGGGYNNNWKNKNKRGGGKSKPRNNRNRTAPYQNKTKAKRKCGLCAEEGFYFI
ncbi:prokaryotic dna topoisomerase [Holotrichia oblita]|uniref:Prokaryotic dna topoisomerase n=1 Tax=Holotrichia oblita TaxID=644536 RepID=A0ACB9SQB7_HOLOL|nr:prokaryotic dna topoisomerase [Holotrichia oblita]